VDARCARNVGETTVGQGEARSEEKLHELSRRRDKLVGQEMESEGANCSVVTSREHNVRG
jgi:hypothetical protein